MLALKIILGILIALLFLLLIPIGCRVRYSSEGLNVRLKVLFFSFTLYPKTFSPRKAKKLQGKRTRGDGKRSSGEESSEKKGTLSLLLQLSKPILAALNDLRIKLQVRHFHIDYAIGGKNDPAGASIKYGVVSAGGGALFPLINGAFRVKNWEVNLGVDYDAEETKVFVDAVGTYLLGQLLTVAILFGFRALRIYSHNQPKIQEDMNHGK